jgi:HD-like signal output (HDOD) protein
VAEIVSKDIAICAKVLQLANSGFFGAARRVASIQQAVTVLGTATIRNLALSVEVFRAFEKAEAVPGFSPQALQDHALLTASIASRLLPNRQESEDAFSAGMLHDVGQLVLAAAAPARLAEPLKVAHARGVPLHVAEHEQFGITHAEVGAYLLGLWGLPYPIIEAVAFHHAPDRVAHERFDVLTAVHVANLLAVEQAGPAMSRPTDALDTAADYLESLGIVPDLPGWRSMAAEQAMAVS